MRKDGKQPKAATQGDAIAQANTNVNVLLRTLQIALLRSDISEDTIGGHVDRLREALLAQRKLRQEISRDIAIRQLRHELDRESPNITALRTIAYEL